MSGPGLWGCAGGSLGLPDSAGAGSLRGVVPEQQAEVDTWVVMEYCNRGTLQVGRPSCGGEHRAVARGLRALPGCQTLTLGRARYWHGHSHGQCAHRSPWLSSPTHAGDPCLVQ